jgi:hypothetical protein
MPALWTGDYRLDEHVDSLLNAAKIMVGAKNTMARTVHIEMARKPVPDRNHEPKLDARAWGCPLRRRESAIGARNTGRAEAAIAIAYSGYKKP